MESGDTGDLSRHRQLPHRDDEKGHAFACPQRVEKLLPPPFMGEVARWIRAKPGAAGSEGVPTFQRKVGISEYLLRKYSDSPRPSGTPLINAGGKIMGFHDIH